MEQLGLEFVYHNVRLSHNGLLSLLLLHSPVLQRAIVSAGAGLDWAGVGLEASALKIPSQPSQEDLLATTFQGRQNLYGC